MLEKNLVITTAKLLRERGQKSLEIAREALKEEQIKHKPLADALNYFADETFPIVMQPGLLSIYCEAAGGKPEDTIKVGGAMTLLVASADIHDDLIDESFTKNGKPTILGKYGRAVTVLAGDAFLLKGMVLLDTAVEELPAETKALVRRLIKQAFFDLSSAEAEEANLRGNIDLSTSEYFNLLKKKTVVSEATAKIGAILGGGTLNTVKTLGEIGAIIGMLSILRDEFIDVYETEELENRYTHEILPLPVLVAFQDPEKKTQIIDLLGRKGKLTNGRTRQIVSLVMKSEEVKQLKQKMRLMLEDGHRLLLSMELPENTLRTLLEASVEDLQ